MWPANSRLQHQLFGGSERVLARNDARWNADGHAIVGDIAEDDGIGADGNVVADANGAEKLGAGADVDAITDMRRPTLLSIAQAHRDAVADDAIITEDGVAADDDSAYVFDDEALAEHNFAGDLNAAEAIGKELEQSVEERERHAQCAAANAVSPVAEAIDGKRPEAVPTPVVIVNAPIAANAVEHLRFPNRLRGPCGHAAE